MSWGKKKEKKNDLFIVFSAAGKVGEHLLLDLNYREDSAGVDFPVAILASSEKVVLCQMDSKIPGEGV